MHERVRESAKRHPVVTLATVATVVGLLVSIGPTILWAVNYYETREHARAVEQGMRDLIAETQKQENRNLAWATVQAIKTEITVNRNRSNDCDIREQKRETMSSLERQTCSDYRAALRDAEQRFEAARKTALDLSK